MRNAQPVAAIQHLTRERFIQLPEIDVIDRQSVLLQKFRHREDRPDAHLIRRATRDRHAAVNAERMQPALLGLLAGLIALPCTWTILKAGATMFMQAFPVEIGTIVLHVTPDLEVFSYVLAISVFAGLLFGLAPALEGTRLDLNTVLKDSASRGSGSLGGARFRKFLVAAEMAMAGGRMYAGNPDTVYKQIMEFYDKVGGFGHLIMVGKTGFITHDEAVKNITLFSKEVLPRLREIKPVVVD